MKQITLAGLIIAMLGLITSNSVWARDEGGHGGGFGGSFGGNGKHYSRSLGYYGSFYYSPYVYLPSVPQPQTNYWYYCQDPEGYYPNVNVCPDGWQQVVPNYRYYCQDPEGYYPDVDVCSDGWQQVAPQPDED